MSSSADPPPAEPPAETPDAPPAAPPVEPPADTPYDWDAFAERPAPPELEIDSPAREVRAVLRRYQADLSAERGRARDATGDALAVAVDQGALVARLESALERHREALRAAGLGRVHLELRVLKDQMVEALRGGGVTFEDPAGRPLAEVADRVEVIGWRHAAGYPAEVVAETHDAVVLHRGTVVRPGQVTMGAPPPPAAVPAPAEEQPEQTPAQPSDQSPDETAGGSTEHAGQEQ
ncbi:hypothetical protein [Actinomadura hibisca]|uniref:hypothetical protein n=1 Tax=Actinomadura hibisca TaxID=68565 RepID=UPI00082B3272|nr:hypothetical protein [Actinomadura hibisca]